ncbi:MAG: hypothetical protein MHM6MM_003605 [Cercozoa sp. M6MM]
MPESPNVHDQELKRLGSSDVSGSQTPPETSLMSGDNERMTKLFAEALDEPQVLQQSAETTAGAKEPAQRRPNTASVFRKALQDAEGIVGERVETQRVPSVHVAPRDSNGFVATKRLLKRGSFIDKPELSQVLGELEEQRRLSQIALESSRSRSPRRRSGAAKRSRTAPRRASTKSYPQRSVSPPARGRARRLSRVQEVEQLTGRRLSRMERAHVKFGDPYKPELPRALSPPPTTRLSSDDVPDLSASRRSKSKAKGRWGDFQPWPHLKGAQYCRDSWDLIYKNGKLLHVPLGMGDYKHHDEFVLRIEAGMPAEEEHAPLISDERLIELFETGVLQQSALQELSEALSEAKRSQHAAVEQLKRRVLELEKERRALQRRLRRQDFDLKERALAAIETLQRKLAEAQKNTASQEQLDKLRQELADAVRRYEELDMRLGAERRERQKEQEAVDDERKHLRKQMQDAKDETESVKAERDALRARCEQLEKLFDAWKGDKARLRDALVSAEERECARSNLENERDRLKRAHDALQKRLAETHAELILLRRRVAQLLEQKQQLLNRVLYRAMFRHFHRRARRVQSELSQTEQQVETAKAKAAETEAALRDQIEALRTELANVASEREKQREELRDANALLEQLESALREAYDVNEKNERTMASNRRVLEQEMRSLEDKARTRIQSLRAEIARLKSAFAGDDVRQLALQAAGAFRGDCISELQPPAAQHSVVQALAQAGGGSGDAPQQLLCWNLLNALTAQALTDTHVALLHYKGKLAKSVSVAAILPLKAVSKVLLSRRYGQLMCLRTSRLRPDLVLLIDKRLEFVFKMLQARQAIDEPRGQGEHEHEEQKEIADSEDLRYEFVEAFDYQASNMTWRHVSVPRTQHVEVSKVELRQQ